MKVQPLEEKVKKIKEIQYFETEKDLSFKKLYLSIISVIIIIFEISWGIYYIVDNVINCILIPKCDKSRSYIGFIFGPHVAGIVQSFLFPLIFYNISIYQNIVILITFVLSLVMYFVATESTSIGFEGYITLINIVPFLLISFGNFKNFFGKILSITWIFGYLSLIIFSILYEFFIVNHIKTVEKTQKFKTFYIISNYIKDFLIFVFVILGFYFVKNREDSEKRNFANLYSNFKNLGIEENKDLKYIEEKPKNKCTYFELLLKRMINDFNTIWKYVPQETKYIINSDKLNNELDYDSESDSESNIKPQKSENSSNNYLKTWKEDRIGFIYFNIRNKKNIGETVKKLFELIESVPNDLSKYPIINIKMCKVIIHFNTFRKCFDFQNVMLDYLEYLKTKKKFEDILFDADICLYIGKTWFGTLGTERSRQSDVFIDMELIKNLLSSFTEWKKIKKDIPENIFPIFIDDSSTINGLSYEYNIEEIKEHCYIYKSSKKIKSGVEWNYQIFLEDKSEKKDSKVINKK